MNPENTTKKYSVNRVFKLCQARVKASYNHVGVKVCLLSDDDSRVMEKIGKGRRTLNAASGLGIQKNGLNMATCNRIFWSVVVPTLLFGCELWVLSDKDRDNLQSFQCYAGRRIQHSPQRSPNASSYYGMGWMKLTTFISAKKILLVLTLIRKAEGVLSRIFKLRMEEFLNDRVRGQLNPNRSPILTNSMNVPGLMF